MMMIPIVVGLEYNLIGCPSEINHRLEGTCHGIPLESPCSMFSSAGKRWFSLAFQWQRKGCEVQFDTEH